MHGSKYEYVLEGFFSEFSRKTAQLLQLEWIEIFFSGNIPKTAAMSSFNHFLDDCGGNT